MNTEILCKFINFLYFFLKKLPPRRRCRAAMVSGKICHRHGGTAAMDISDWKMFVWTIITNRILSSEEQTSLELYFISGCS
jgi:hypothetical protein